MLNRTVYAIKFRYRVVAIVLITVATIFLSIRLTAKPLLDDVPFSNAYYDRHGELLKLSLSQDGIYRVYTPIDNISQKIVTATLLYEDRWFFYHIGVNPYSLMRAVKSFISNDRRPLGASTITMQLARIKNDIDSKSIRGKLYQILIAFYYEIAYSKDEILGAYLNLAPYGHNIEGVGAATRIYYKTNAERTTSIEALSLAVIPQNPSKRTPTNLSGIQAIKEARDKLVDRWVEKYPDDNEYNSLFAMDMEVNNIQELPSISLHFVNHLYSIGAMKNIVSTLDLRYQSIVERNTENFLSKNKELGINNASVILINYKDMETLAYKGSANFFDKDIYGQVDGVKAYRSPGSTMKPFIYALAIEQGLIHPKSMLKDAPKRFGTYSPENSDKGFMGPIFAVDTLINSRNIPAVDLLNKLDNSSFYNLLKSGGVQRLRSESYYGSALALGGFELTMLDVAYFYASLANFGNGKCIKFTSDGNSCYGKNVKLLTDEASYLVVDMLYANGKLSGYDNVGRVAWKTGTSFGYRDAWTAGIFGDYILVVWIGNFDGRGNPAFKGRESAAELFFTIVNGIKNISGERFPKLIPIKPLNIKDVDICKPTGDLANKYCPETVVGKFIPGVSPLKISDIFQEISIDKVTKLRACNDDPKTTYKEIYEFWPSDIYELFLKSGIRKKVPPKYMSGCVIEDYSYESRTPPLIFSPSDTAEYIISKYELGERELSFSASSRLDTKKIFWFLNGVLVGTTEPNKPLFWKMEQGSFNLTATDDIGESSSVHFSVLIK